MPLLYTSNAMDVFGTIASSIDLTERIIAYFGDINEGEEQCLSLRDEIKALALLLLMLNRHLKSEREGSTGLSPAAIQASRPFLEDAMSNISGCFLLTEWEEFDRYASRVRSLSCSDVDEPDGDDTEIKLCTLTEIARIRLRLLLLPALCQLSVNAEYMDYTSVFLHSGLEELVLEFYADVRGIQGVHDLFLLRTMVPGLQKLDIQYPSMAVR
ncbi:hypothetical protein M422DRAFT_259195 [Sphaerobolus stellatus SS14]|uniref:Uncharacterized protein n=1 Tax=Sphaerobolus stellatus (strain SS14) TaxID=990650 RepID=A0A0C9U5M3_SPHS4|nr:hypothetical protein M422DRAFT_259195 [Sphaerobolus stellatus SS14]